MSGRDRSRSRGRNEDVSKLAKDGNSESDIVNVAIKQLPGKIKERLEKLFEEGLLKENDLDLRSITVFASLNEGLQDRVMTHMENERIYVANARSKSGFLIATCDKAKTGCLDARGLGAIDPWRSALVAMATPKQKMIDLEPERDWLDKYGTDPIKLHVNIGIAEKEVGMPRVTVELPLTDTAAAVKSKLASMGIESIPVNKMKLHTEPVGFLKDRYSLAYYNLNDGVELELSVRARAGVKFRKDHAVPLKRPKTQDRPATAPLEGAPPKAGTAPAPGPDLGKAKAAIPGGMPGLPGLPSLPGLPGLPSLPSLPGGTAAKPSGLPSLPGLPGGMPTLPGLAGKAPGLPGMTMPGLSMPGLGGTMPGLSMPGGMPGSMPKLNFDPKALGMTAPEGAPPGLAMPKFPDLSSMPKMPPGMPDLAAMAKLPGMPDLSAMMAKLPGMMAKGGMVAP